MSDKTQGRPIREITIDSNWIVTVLMAVLGVICSAMLIREIRDFAFANAVEQQPLTEGLFTKVFEGIAAIYCFISAFSFRKKPVKLAFLLTAVDLSVGVVLSYFHLGSGFQHFVGVARSALRQVALTIFIVAIVQWFKSVVSFRSIPPQRTAD